MTKLEKVNATSASRCKYNIAQSISAKTEASTMRTPSLASPSSPFSDHQSQSSAIVTPTTCRNTVRFLQCSLYSDEDSDDSDMDVEQDFHWRVGPRSRHRKRSHDQKTRHRHAEKAADSTNVSPSKFVVKGTVTPSRAAPIFAKFSTTRRADSRSASVCNNFEDEDEMDENWACRQSLGESPTKKSSKVSTLPLQQSFIQTTIDQGKCTSDPTEKPLLQARCSSFIPSEEKALPPLTPIPFHPIVRRRMATSDVASYLHAIRSNSLAHLTHAPSSRGALLHSAGLGALGASRALGAGAPGIACSISHRAFHNKFQTTSTPHIDLFTLPSQRNDRNFAQPICAEYANSARCLDADHPQWLAVSSNEGMLTLLDTSTHCGPCSSSASFPVGENSIFEAKWRFDDEMIATGGSDYRVRLWDTSSLQHIASFSGHRGSPRSMAWDPASCGHLLASGGRDGAIHIFDTRVGGRSQDGEGSPIISLWGAHSKPLRGRRSRTSPKGVTSLAYVPSRGSNVLCSAGCGDGALKLWDLRALASSQQASFEEGKVVVQQGDMVAPPEQSRDISSFYQGNKSSHGVSCIAVGSRDIFAACTDGCIYSLQTADFFAGHSTSSGLANVPLFHPAQRGNTLYARLALHDDERTLALGNNSGTITIWDTHTAMLAASELDTLGVSARGGVKPTYAMGSDAIQGLAKPSILGGHRSNFEINSVTWAHGHDGPKLASVADDSTIRTWSATHSDGEHYV